MTNNRLKDEFRVGDYAVLDNKFIVKIIDIFYENDVIYVKVIMANEVLFNIEREVPMDRLNPNIG